MLPADRYNLGMYFCGFYFYERCIPFGIHPGPSLFEEFATALEKICIQKVTPVISQYLDDFLLVSDHPEASAKFERVLSIFN